jgi:GAF domain-containing protein
MPDSAADKLKQLISIATQLSSTLHVEELLQLIMTSAAELLDARSGSLLLLDQSTNELVFRVASSEPELVGQRMPADKGVAGQALQGGKPVVVSDASQDQRVYREVDQAMGTATESLIAVPLLAGGKQLGVIEVMNKRSGSFTTEDEELAVALASLAAVAIENASMYASLADAVVTARLSYRL